MERKALSPLILAFAALLATAIALASAELAGPGLNLGFTVAAGLPMNAPPPAISLTLVPPSPVTNRIALDIRGAVRNSGEKSVRFDLEFFLDREAPEALLHREAIDIEAKGAAGVKFPWPLEEHAGRHEIILVAKSGGAEIQIGRAHV
jgi:hypothetical protein